jgi:D-hydroxyproline dehydrogenase subunit gamma
MRVGILRRERIVSCKVYIIGYNQRRLKNGDLTHNIAADAAQVVVSVNGRLLPVPAGSSVAAAILLAGEASRISASGEMRGPLCGMGICMECCATVNGVQHVRTCQFQVAPGMEIVPG